MPIGIVCHFLILILIFWPLPSLHPPNVSHFHILVFIFFFSLSIWIRGPNHVFVAQIQRNEVLLFLVKDIDCVLNIVIIYANYALSSPSFQFPHKKVTEWGFLLEAQSRVGLQRPWGCNVKGKRWNQSCLIYILLIKWEFVGFKNLFLSGGIDDLILVGVGTYGF